jgi:hypothetical protein
LQLASIDAKRYSVNDSNGWSIRLRTRGLRPS